MCEGEPCRIGPRELAGEHQTEGRTDPDHERLQRRPLRNMAESCPKTESVQRMVGSTCIPTFEVRDKALLPPLLSAPPASPPNAVRLFVLVHSTGSPLHLLLLRTPSHPRLDPPCNAYVTAKHANLMPARLPKYPRLACVTYARQCHGVRVQVQVQHHPPSLPSIPSISQQLILAVHTFTDS